jgi:uncharacterized protein (DUF1697 family)
MQNYCAFLRGINVNGIAICMEDLRKSFEEEGFQKVQTILNTGNVLFSADESDLSQLRQRVERMLCERFQYDAYAFIRNRDQLAAAIEGADKISVGSDCYAYLLFLDEPGLAEELEQQFQAVNADLPESLTVLSSDCLWVVPKGETLTSAFGSKILGSKKYKSRLTSRNLNTVRKVLIRMG